MIRTVKRDKFPKKAFKFMELFRYLKVVQLEQNAITGGQKTDESG
jgi:hypothetical protein